MNLSLLLRSISYNHLTSSYQHVGAAHGDKYDLVVLFLNNSFTIFSATSLRLGELR